MTIPAFWNENLTAALVNHLWQSTVVAGIAWLLTLALRRNHAGVRYWVWMAASLKFLLPFSLLISAGEWLRALVPAAPVTRPAVATVVEQVTQPFPATEFLDMTVAPVAAHHASLSPATVLLLIWACGALIVVGRFARGWWAVYQAMRAARPLDLAVGVPVVSSASRIEPGIFGILRPVLLMPEGILQRLTAEQLSAILAHELCHVRRRDNLTYAMHMIVEVLFWFHPAVWWIGACLIDERERACDEAVVQSVGEAQVYAEGILNVCKFYVESPLTCVAGVTGADLKKRIARIMSELSIRKIDFGRKVLLAATSVIAVAVPLMLGVAHMSRVNAQEATAQDLAGIWQGALHIEQPSRDLRTELRITKNADGSYKLVMYSIDQGGQPAPASKTAFENGTLSVAIDRINGKYEGKMSDDGKTITGTWTQGPSPLALNLTRTPEDAAWPIPEPPKPMAADADPSFDVVTIKPSKPGAPGKGFTFRGRHGLTFNTNMNDLISFAYGVHSSQIVGAPDWFGSELFDIDGVPNVEGQPSSTQFKSMMQKLLADRFHLKFHHEQRELSVYVITVAPGGPKMEKSDAPAGQGGFFFRGCLGDLTVTNNSMSDFAHGDAGGGDGQASGRSHGADGSLQLQL